MERLSGFSHGATSKSRYGGDYSPPLPAAVSPHSPPGPLAICYRAACLPVLQSADDESPY